MVNAVSFSVIIPNYNHAKYLPEQLDAIFSQSLQPNEVLVVDDASTDESCEVVAAYQKRYTHLFLHRLEKNSGGPIRPLEEGVKHATGDYLVLCASDDIVQSEFFREAAEYSASHPEIAICFGDCFVFEDQKPYRFHRGGSSFANTPKIFYPDEWVKVSRSCHLDIPSHSVFYKKSAFLAVGGYKENLAIYADYYLNYKIAFQYPIAYVPRIWGANRLVKQSYGRRLKGNKRADFCKQLMMQLKSESKILQDRWRKSGILARVGREILYYISRNKKYWKYVPGIIGKYISLRIREVFRRGLHLPES